MLRTPCLDYQRLWHVLIIIHVGFLPTLIQQFIAPRCKQKNKNNDPFHHITSRSDLLAWETLLLSSSYIKQSY